MRMEGGRECIRMECGKKGSMNENRRWKGRENE